MSKTLCYYTIARYLPNPVRGEFVNVGVVLQSATTGFIGSKFLNDYSHIRDFDPSVNELALRDFATVSRGKINSFKERVSESRVGTSPSSPEFIALLSRLYSGVVEYGTPRAVLTENPADELNRLYEEIVSPVTKQSSDSEFHLLGTTVGSADRPAFKYTVASLRRDVIKGLLKSPQLHAHIERKYKVKGSVTPWIFDAGLRNGAIHIVQTLSFDVETAEAKQDRALILKAKIDDARGANPGVDLNAYAIVLPPAGKNSEGYAESIKLLNRSAIKARGVEQLKELVGELERRIETH